MKNPLKMIDPTMQKMLLGGLIGSLSYYGDLVLAEQSFYPAMLKGKVSPQLPRNDELLTSIAPPAIMYLLAKKKSKLKEMAKGTMMYSGPHLLQRIVVSATKPAVAPASFKMPMQFVMPSKVAAPIYSQPMQSAPMRVNMPSQAQAPTMGKYR